MDVASQNRFQDLMQASVFKVHPKLFLLVGGCSKDCRYIQVGAKLQEGFAFPGSRLRW